MTTWCALPLPGIKIATSEVIFYIGGLIHPSQWEVWRFLAEVLVSKTVLWGERREERGERRGWTILERRRVTGGAETCGLPAGGPRDMTSSLTSSPAGNTSLGSQEIRLCSNKYNILHRPGMFCYQRLQTFSWYNKYNIIRSLTYMYYH